MANKYLHASGGTGNFSDDTGTWRTTDQGATVTTHPTSADVALMTSNAGARTLTIDTTSAASALNANGFTGTITGSGAMTITGAITLDANTTFTPSGAWTWGVSSTSSTFAMRTNRSFSNDFTFGGTGSKVLTGGTLAINGVTRITATHTLTTSDSSIVQAKGGWDCSSYYWNTSASAPKVYLQGGLVTGTLPTSSNGVYLDGTLTSTPNMAASTLTLRDNTNLIWNSGTFDLTNTIVYLIVFQGHINTGTHIQWHALDWRGTGATLDDDLYCDLWCTNGGTYAINGGKKIYVKNGIAARGACSISGAVEFVVTDTATIFSNTAYYTGSGSYPGLLTMSVPVTIDAPGKTITCDTRSGDVISFGGGGTLTLTNGSIVTTGSNWSVTTGGYTFNIPASINSLNTTASVTSSIRSNFTTTTAVLDAGSTTNYSGANLTIGTLRMNGNAILSGPNDGSILNVTTTIYSNGTDSLQPAIITSPITLTDFVTSLTTTMANNSSGASYRRVSFANQTASDYTIAFDFNRTSASSGTQVLTGSSPYSYLWIPPGYAQFYYYLTPSDAYYFSYPNTGRVRIVISKASGGDIKVWYNGVAKSVGYTGTLATLRATNVAISGIWAKELLGDILYFQTTKDQAWVDSDYAKFVANGNTSAGTYDATEPNLIAGWHTDSWTSAVTDMIFKYDGTLANEMIFRGDFRFVNASSSASRILTYFGTTNDSENVYAVTNANFGGFTSIQV